MLPVIVKTDFTFQFMDLWTSMDWDGDSEDVFAKPVSVTSNGCFVFVSAVEKGVRALTV